MCIRGAIEQKTAHSIIGWLAISSDRPDTPVIEVIHNGKLIGSATANQMRTDVRDAGFGDGRCGFVFRMPPIFENADVNKIELRLRGTEIYLTQSINTKTLDITPQHGGGSVFILGPARSGTSVTYLALREVLGLSGLGESHVPQIFQRMAFQFYEYVKNFSDSQGVLAHRLSVKDFRLSLINYVRSFYFEQYEGTPFVDKTPGLEALTGLPFLKEVFPYAKFIIMERNGIETILSYQRKFGASFEDALSEWASCAKESSRLKAKFEDVLVVNQNEMKRNPQDVATHIADYLGKPEHTAKLTSFFRESRQDITTTAGLWDAEIGITDTKWSDDEKAEYTRVSHLIAYKA